MIPGSGLKSLTDLERRGDYGGLVLALASGLVLVLATLFYLATLLGVPLIAWRDWRRDRRLPRETSTALMMLAGFCLVAVFYALAHIETRLMLPMVPAGLGAAAFVTGTCRKRWYPAARSAKKMAAPDLNRTPPI